MTRRTSLTRRTGGPLLCIPEVNPCWRYEYRGRISTAVEITGKTVELPTDGGSVRRYGGRRWGLKLGGGLNQPSRKHKLEKWAGTYGLWCLTDAALGTCASDHPSDKLSYRPGDGVPAAFLRTNTAGEDDQGQEGIWFPGATGIAEVGGHHPISLDLPYGKEPRHHLYESCE